MSTTVYYLDDEAALCDIFAEFFGSDLIHVTTFLDADKAIEACRLTPPDLFFIDFRLPNTTGDQVALALDRSIPKILLTGDFSFKLECKFDQIISKPFQFDEIQDLINRYS